MTTQQYIDLPTVNQAPDIRITQLDVLRGFAVLGIYWINVVIFGLPSGGYALPNMLGQAQSLNIGHWMFSELFVEGSMRGLFSMLFGASAMIFLSESRLGASGLMIVDRYYRRNLLLVLFGVIHAYLFLWPYDVLYAYGLIGLFLFPLRKLGATTLIIAGCLLLVIGDLEYGKPLTEKPDSLLVSNLDETQSDEPAGEAMKDAANIKNKQAENYRESMQAQMEDDTILHQSGYLKIFQGQLEEVVSQQSLYMYSVHFYDIGGMMLIGMALLKLGVLSGKRSLGFYIALALAGYAISMAIRSFNISSELSHGFVTDDITEHGGVTYEIGRLPLTLGHIGLIGILCHYSIFNFMTNTVAKVGRLALSNYIMQTLISVWLFYGVGWGLIGVFERYQLTYVCLAVWVIQITFSIKWLKHFQYGPLEWVWRSLIYGKRQPMLKPV